MRNGTKITLREIKNFERSEVREIKSKFAYLYREKNRDRHLTSRDRELREIEVRAIEIYLYIYTDTGQAKLVIKSSEYLITAVLKIPCCQEY